MNDNQKAPLKESSLSLLNEEVKISVNDQTFLQMNALLVDIMTVLTNIPEIDSKVVYQPVILADCLE